MLPCTNRCWVSAAIDRSTKAGKPHKHAQLRSSPPWQSHDDSLFCSVCGACGAITLGQFQSLVSKLWITGARTEVDRVESFSTYGHTILGKKNMVEKEFANVVHLELKWLTVMAWMFSLITPRV